MCSEIVNMYFKLSLKIVNFDDCLMKTKYKFFLSPGGGPGGRVQNGGGLLIEGASGLYGSNRSKNRTKSCINLLNFYCAF
jgi:hypothetical protein